MRNTLEEKQLLHSIQQKYSIINLNSTSHNIDSIIKNMEIMESEPPDFIYGEDTYIEHFEVNAYQRVKKKDGKLHSVHLADEAKLKKRVNHKQSVFRATHYHTPDNRANTRYLKENVDNIISEKTKKQKEYDKKCPNVNKRHLLIELKSRCELILGSDGQYLDYEAKYDYEKNPREFYEVYRDLCFMKALKEKYSDAWDLLLFIDEFKDCEFHIFYLYCFDLKEGILHNNMKNYPDRLFQIIKSGMQVMHMSGAINATNIRYDVETGDDALSSFLNSYDADTMTVNNISLFKSCHDSVYTTKDKGLQFETSQRAFAINPDVESDIMAGYIPLLLEKKLILDCQGTIIKLKRKTLIEDFFYSDGTNASYRIDDKTVLQLKLIFK